MPEAISQAIDETFATDSAGDLEGIATLIRSGPTLVLFCKAKSLKNLRVTIGESL